MSSATAEKTDPALWGRTVATVKASDKGGKPGEWSARKAQLAVAEYKKAGGGYRGQKAADNHLAEWTREEWGTKSGAASGDTGERYLPKRARDSLTEREYAATTKRKQADTAKGQQHSPQPAAIARKTAALRKADPVAEDFRRLVNMTGSALSRWLGTKRSKEVGLKRDGGESVGHASGLRIVEILAKGRQAEPSAEDRAHMRKVISYIKRHSAQRPQGDIRETTWRASLKNWGHDPLKDAPQPD